MTFLSLFVAMKAEGQATATIEGVVRDATGAVMSGVIVHADAVHAGIVRATTTGGDGSYRLLGLPAGFEWQLRASADGFSEDRRRIEALASGEHRVVDLALAPASVSAHVNVSAEAPIGRTTTPELGGTVARDRIESLPVNGRDLIALAYLVPGAAPARGFYNLAPRLTINGSSSLVTNYSIDGFDNTDLFLGGPKVPSTLESTDTLRVLVNSYSSEYGRTGNGVFSVTTRSGSSIHHGDAFYVVRPGNALDSTNFFAPRDQAGNVIPDHFQRHQFGESVGGPLASVRTVYFANMEVTREHQDAILSSPLAVGLAPTTFHNHEILGKLDRRWNSDQITTIRYTFSDYTHDKDAQFIGGLTLPSAGLQVNYHNQFAALSHRSILSSAAVNELGVQVGQLRSDWRPLDGGPRAIVTDRGSTLAVIGAVSDNFFWTENDVQVRDVYSWIIGPHTVRIGGDLLRADFDIRSGPGARGVYTVDLQGQRVSPSGPFVTLGDLPRSVAVLSSSQTFRNPEIRHPQTLLAPFAEDSVRPIPDLTLSLGARWDYDSVTDTPVG
ncbi:MAG TPA: carboxypeptidase-like regulatory domain-containing protein, partial [Vicinamibacterales bacterium]|nr:carboxypeptidase-like regulatory domain-containing protein [Vicinamibacterales bacterium]